MKRAEVHGMSQRGGDVQSNLRISDQPIASDLIPSGKCDLIISLEPMEGLRYLPYLSPNGWLDHAHAALLQRNECAKRFYAGDTAFKNIPYLNRQNSILLVD